MKKLQQIFSNLSPKWKVLLIFMVAFLIRLSMNIIFQGIHSPPDPAMGVDHVEYDQVAQNLAFGKGFRMGNGGPSTGIPPGTSFLLFPIYLLFGVHYPIARIMISLLSAATCIIVYFIGKRLVNEKFGLLASVLLAVYPMHFYYSMHFFSEIPWALFMSAAILSALFFEQKEKAIYGILMGLFIGFSAYIRPTALFYLPFYWLLCFFHFRNTRKKLIKLITIPLLSLILTVIPWTIRNYKVTGHFVLISTHGGVTFWGAHNEKIFNDPKLIGTWIPHTELPEIKEYYQIQNTWARDKAAYTFGFNFVKRHLKDMPKLEAMKFYRLVTPFYETSNKLFNIIGGGSWGVLLFFVIFGIINSFKNIKFISLHSVVMLTLFIALLFYGDHRFREAIAPMLIIYGSAGLLYVRRFVKGFFRT